ncbi:hypothetical protein BDB00DRAFT_834402 [Zychaea mexicana]|uniref:uncharacterized protein n=1 Tax=Zychaea mexicana TaxID=64656 RepID=UPI0022FDB3E4|nr:uncharacterized protein BDB00DRAFT_834402 [Zychaea mexicana]KAI9491225.1 hypothetical protein BDB00DRAFT_834402 [Zychaea mexicana]
MVEWESMDHGASGSLLPIDFSLLLLLALMMAALTITKKHSSSSCRHPRNSPGCRKKKAMTLFFQPGPHVTKTGNQRKQVSEEPKKKKKAKLFYVQKLDLA